MLAGEARLSSQKDEPILIPTTSAYFLILFPVLENVSLFAVLLVSLDGIS